MHKLIVSILSPFALVAVLIAASHAQPPPKQVTPSFIHLGIGDHDEPNVDPELPVLRHEVEHYYDRSSDRIMTYEEIDYEDGSQATRIGPHRSELDRQAAPQPADIQPPPCTLVVQTATNQANAQAGTCHCNASVLCQMNGGLQSCPKVGFSLSIYQLQPNGLWTRINYLPGESPMNLLCNGIVRPFVDSGVGAAGTYRFKWDGWNTATNASLWSLTTQIDYTG
jgi:hypothetical protein